MRRSVRIFVGVLLLLLVASLILMDYHFYRTTTTTLGYYSYNNDTNNIPRPFFRPPAPAADHNLTVLCHKFKGRLGNQLFQYAAVLGLARRLRRVPVFTTGPSHTSALLHPPPARVGWQLLKRCARARTLWEKACCRFDQRFVEMDPRVDYRVGRYLQSWKYFQGTEEEEEVRKAVVFREDVRRQANATTESLRREGKCNRTLVGVHVRRGDFLKPGSMKGGYVTPPPDYYRKAMTYMRRRFGNVTFLVSVADKSWFLTSVRSAGDVIVLKRHTPAVDMALLASLDHVIISVGTYSWWVGYLNKGVTVYWKDFINPGTFIGNSFDPNGTTFIYPGWIPL